MMNSKYSLFLETDDRGRSNWLVIDESFNIVKTFGGGSGNKTLAENFIKTLDNSAE